MDDEVMEAARLGCASLSEDMVRCFPCDCCARDTKVESRADRAKVAELMKAAWDAWVERGEP